jgi:hypothetical protein
MCKAFSCLVTRGKKVYWKAGLDSHEEILDYYQAQDNNLNDGKVPPLNTFARIEILPPGGDYLNADFEKWKFQIDESIKPSFLEAKHEDLCRQTLLDWAKEVYTFNLKEARHPIHPFQIIPPLVITEEHLDLLKQWDSVRNSVWDYVGTSVRDSVWASVCASACASVRNSVWASVCASVGASVRNSVVTPIWNSVWASILDSVGTYIGSLFPLSEWKYIDYSNPLFEKGKYPFQSAVDLWKMGLVPSFDGKTWRLHGGTDARVLWEGKI